MISYKFGDISLGPIREENSLFYFTHRNNRDIWKWCRQFDVLREGDHYFWMKRALGEDPTVRMYEIRHGKHEDVLGVCGLTDIDMLNRRAEFSCYIVPWQQKKGHAKNALKTLFTHGFYNLGLNSIWGETFENNPALKLFIRLGMRHEGIRQQFYFRDGKFIDANLVSITRHEFDSIQKEWKPATYLRGSNSK